MHHLSVFTNQNPTVDATIEVLKGTSQVDPLEDVPVG